MSTMLNVLRPASTDSLDQALTVLDNHKDKWAKTCVAERIKMLRQMKENLMPIAERWATVAAHEKGISLDSPLVGEEWIAGPYACMAGLNLYIETLSSQPQKSYLDKLAKRTLVNRQLAVKVFPHNTIEKLLADGVTAEIWMEPGVTADNLAAHTGRCYQHADTTRSGKVALVLGAGNVAAIAPLDVLYKLLVEHEVCILKLNPVNEYLYEFFDAMLKPAIAAGAVRIVKGGADVGAYLSEHPLVSTIHITGSEAVHDAIVWGTGDEAKQRKAAGTPKNARPIHSELGAITPTIIVPGPWSEADIRAQAENLISQKLNNSGFNCAASQVMLLSSGWNLAKRFEEEVKRVMRQAPQRKVYYPGASKRIDDLKRRYPNAEVVAQADEQCPRLYVPMDANPKDRFLFENEVFGPAIARVMLDESDPEKYLRAAIAFSNQQLRGTLSANIIIHPKTLKAMGSRFEEMLIDLKYGAIGVNVWAAYSFLLGTATWGAFPGHTLDDIQSGRGVVHNAFMFEKPQRTVVQGPFRTALKQPWFITHRTAHELGRKLTEMEYRPSLMRLPGILLTALRG